MGTTTKVNLSVTYETNYLFVEVMDTQYRDSGKYMFHWTIDTLPVEKKYLPPEHFQIRVPYNASIFGKVGMSYGPHSGEVIVEEKTGGKIAAGSFNFSRLLPVHCSGSPAEITEGDTVQLTLTNYSDIQDIDPEATYTWITDNDGVKAGKFTKKEAKWVWNTNGLQPGAYQAKVQVYDQKENLIGEGETKPVMVKPRSIQKGDILPVTLRRTVAGQTADQGLWAAMRNRIEAVGFKRYRAFIENVFWEEKIDENLVKPYQKKFGPGLPAMDTRLSIHAVDAYNVLRLATEVFLLLECGVVKKKNDKVTIIDPSLFDPYQESARMNDKITIGDIETRLTRYFNGPANLPYLTRILDALLWLDPEKRQEKLPYCDAVLQNRFSCPSLLELIWSYWHEEGMLVQTMNAITLRFQNRRGFSDRDPLAELEIDPLRPLNNLLWGYVQNEYNRLTIPRRAYEYDHHYGLTLYGKVVPQLRSADSRSKFLQGFHNLIYRASVFYRDDSDTTVIADAFPLLQAIREVHLILAEGAHNQFGDLPWTARVEMLIEQWLLARPEMQDFLHGRAMVPYREEWMGRVDAMKKLQGWSDVTVTHFQELAMYGEQIILTIRYGDWMDVNDEDQAKNWARYWKPEIQGYTHAYRAATGVDLSTEPVDATPPWVHLKRSEDRKRINVRA